MLEEFHEELDHYSCKTNIAHHDQTPAFQVKDVLSLITMMEDLDNPFGGKGTDHDHLILYSKEFTDHL